MTEIQHIQKIINLILKKQTTDPAVVNKIIYTNPFNKTILKKTRILEVFEKNLAETGAFSTPEMRLIKKALQMKAVRTISGVTPVTVLTKPFPCPGKCIFCPSDVRMPKSYLANEPGAQRALANKFDPYYQTYNRLVALKSTGHSTDKVELLVLGGTWTAYSLTYRIWFIKRCFDALNDFNPQNATYLEPIEDNPQQSLDPDTVAVSNENLESGTAAYNSVVASLSNVAKTLSEKAELRELEDAQKKNEVALSRCIGLVVETRPDEITSEVLVLFRKFGVTKVQIGVQSLNDEILKKNKRGHTVEQVRHAFDLLRRFGFKIHAHWMPNLYGSDPQQDKQDFDKLFSDSHLCPDELKIYPCSLISGTPLMNLYKKKLWRPYNHDELVDVLTHCIVSTPRYCRLSRIVRDIPSTDIVDGNKLTNFRQIAEGELKRDRKEVVEIRSREIKGTEINSDSLEFINTSYETAVSAEYFLEYVSKNKLVGFLRLSIPKQLTVLEASELSDCSIIREIHVYGESIDIGDRKSGAAQHLGIGKQLIKHAVSISRTSKPSLTGVCVISSVGTREYYRKNGFTDGDLYQKLSFSHE